MSLKTLYQIQEVLLSWSHIFAQFTITYLNTIFLSEYNNLNLMKNHAKQDFNVVQII